MPPGRAPEALLRGSRGQEGTQETARDRSKRLKMAFRRRCAICRRALSAARVPQPTLGICVG
eukprot:10441697-Alexandrium_andersonii.AAC.1